jgi:hypothetical protein
VCVDCGWWSARLYLLSKCPDWVINKVCMHGWWCLFLRKVLSVSPAGLSQADGMN